MRTGFFVLRVFICFLEVGILEEVSVEDLNRIFISFPGVSINMLIHHNECIEWSGSFSGLFHLQRMSWKRTRTEVALPLHGLECVNHLLLSVLG